MRSQILSACAFVFVACGAGVPRSHSAALALAPLGDAYESLMRAHGLSEWNEYTHEAPSGAPPGDIPSAEHALFVRAQPFARMVAGDRDATATQRRVAQLWLDGALGLDLIADPEVARLSHLLEHQLDAHVFERNGQRLTRSDIRTLALSPDANDRRAALQLDAGVHREVVETARALLHRRVAVARALGVPSVGDALLRLRGIEPERWDALARAILTGTEASYARLVAEGARRIGASSVSVADATLALTQDIEWSNARLPADHAVDFARATLGDLGFDLDHPPIRLVIREFAFGGQTLAIHVPDDVRTVIRPLSGVRFYATLLHELGHALQATRTEVTDPLLRGYEWVPGLTSPGFDEGMAEVFGTLLRDASVLEAHTSLTADERTRLVEAGRGNALVSLRAQLASVAFERAALADPDQDLDALQRRFDHEIRGLDATDRPPTWAATPFLATYPMYTQSYVIAAAVAAQVHASLRGRFGSQWRTPASGRVISATLFGSGETLPWDARVRQATGRELSADDLLAELAR